MAIQKNKIGVIIPAYKAAHTLPKVLASIPDYIDVIVIVDDGSGDATAQTAQEQGKSDPRIHVLVHTKNTGVGGATVTGYHKAAELGCHILVKMDADGQMRPQHLPELLEPLLTGQAHYAKGNRFAHPAQLKAMPASRRLGNTLHSWMTRAATGYWHVFDATNGYTAIQTETFRQLDHQQLPKGYFFETGLLFELRLVEAKIADIAIPAVYEGEKSHIRSHAITIQFPLLLIRGWCWKIYRRHFRRPKRAV